MLSSSELLGAQRRLESRTKEHTEKLKAKAEKERLLAERQRQRQAQREEEERQRRLAQAAAEEEVRAAASLAAEPPWQGGRGGRVQGNAGRPVHPEGSAAQAS